MLTQIDQIATGRRVGRKMLWPEKMVAALPAGTFARMAAVARPEEDKTDFIREAIDRELKRRERDKPKT